MDWEKFNTTLEAHLARLPEQQPWMTEDKFQQAARNLAKTLDNTIAEIVPLSKPNPHSKRWWTHNLTML